MGWPDRGYFAGHYSTVESGASIRQAGAHSGNVFAHSSACSPFDSKTGNDFESRDAGSRSGKAFDQFDLDVRLSAGDGAIGLLGPSGAGKTMSLRMIAGIVTPDRGRIVLNNRILFDSRAGVNMPAAQRKIGVVFQDYALFPNMTVAQNVGFGLLAKPANERRARVEAARADGYCRTRQPQPE